MTSYVQGRQLRTPQKQIRKTRYTMMALSKFKAGSVLFSGNRPCQMENITFSYQSSFAIYGPVGNMIRRSTGQTTQHKIHQYHYDSSNLPCRTLVSNLVTLREVVSRCQLNFRGVTGRAVHSLGRNFQDSPSAGKRNLFLGTICSTFSRNGMCGT